MNKICEIYDVSLEYEMSENSLLIIVSELQIETICAILPELEKYKNQIMSPTEWNEFLNINKTYNKNENKFHMREIRQSQKKERKINTSFSNNEIDNIFDNKEMQNRINYALSFLSEQPKRRFLKYYYEHCTYRKIAKDEERSLSTIYESINYAKKTFLKYFYEYPEQNTPNKCK